ncbi:MAG: bifunctional folylpolyglutamate synthase/dihydrofolate synthase [Magnetococcales bacterium]|nr:bifunctional folylpolyglutamate synthase/dihydrofolate synthase [Magnetococcales bacterium]
MSTSLPELLQQISRQTPVAVQLGLQRVETLLQALGNPERQLPILHVAGTNGKGSVLAYLERVLLLAGFRVGLYTSPHLHRINERFRLQGQAVDDAILGRLLADLLHRFPQQQATFFEWLTVLAFCLFREQGLGCRKGGAPAVVLLETGLGGRLDATNVVQPLLTLITRIDWDHTDYLGHSLQAIAGEKAGIFKAGIPALVMAQLPEVVAVLRLQAERLAVPMALQGRDFTCCRSLSTGSEQGDWQYQEGDSTFLLPAPSLPGVHQYDNATLAVAALRHLQRQHWPISDQAIRAGIASTHWPARLEWMHWPGKPELAILLDGAHNPSGCRVLADYLQGLDGRSLFLFAALRDKPVQEMVTILAPLAKQVYTVAVGGERALTAEQLASFWHDAGCAATACASPEEGLQRAAACASTRIVICGSLYLAGQLREFLQNLAGK